MQISKYQQTDLFRWNSVLLHKFIQRNQNTTRNLWRSTSFRGLHQKKPVLNSSGSWSRSRRTDYQLLLMKALY